MRCRKASHRLSWVLLSGAAMVLGAGLARADALVDFEDLVLSPNSHFEGSDSVWYDWTPTDNPWSSRGMVFHNLWAVEHYEWPPASGIWYDYTAWQGQTCSNHTWTGTPPTGLAGEYVAYPGSGAGGSANYAVVFRTSEDVWEVGGPGSGVFDAASYVTLDLPAGEQIQSLYVANNTYVWDTIKHGDAYGFAKPFGGVSGGGGSDPDWFLLTITGLDAAGQPIAAAPVDVYLADYRAPDPAGDYILEDWLFVDLSHMAEAASLQFRLKSTDVGPYGMNTPAYFLIDNIAFSSSGAAVVPEPSAAVLAGLGAALLGAVRVLRRRRR